MGYRPVEFQIKDLDMGQRLQLMNAGLDALEPATDTQTWLGISSQKAAERAGRRGLGVPLTRVVRAPPSLVADSLADGAVRSPPIA